MSTRTKKADIDEINRHAEAIFRGCETYPHIEGRYEYWAIDLKYYDKGGCRENFDAGLTLGQAVRMVRAMCHGAFEMRKAQQEVPQ